MIDLSKFKTAKQRWNKLIDEKLGTQHQIDNLNKDLNNLIIDIQRNGKSRSEIEKLMLKKESIFNQISACHQKMEELRITASSIRTLALNELWNEL